MMIRIPNFSARRRRVLRWAVCLLITLAAANGPLSASAQDGKRSGKPWWDDAPIAPRYRTEADWLVATGQISEQEAFGPFPTHEYQVGDEEQFIPLGSASDYAQTFTLRYRTDHAYFWFERGAQVNVSDLKDAGQFFEDNIWPTDNAIFGTEWNPGIDGDPRLHIVNQEFIEPGIMGAFNPEDECPRSICVHSNQREIIYISLEAAPVNSQDYLATLAHEYQHLIRHHIDGNEARWLNEGFSQLAEHLNGFHPRYVGGDNLRDFLRDPDHQLNGWTAYSYDLGRYYGASYLFTVYLYERFGLEFIQAVATADYDGLAAVQSALVRTGQSETVDDVFAAWIVANFLDDPTAADGQYAYQTLDLPFHIQPQMLDVSNGDAPYTDTVSQYGADYLSFSAPGTYDITFDGTDLVNILGVTPRSGDWMWWSYNNDSSSARLTGAFDLTGLDTATLVFSAWWDVEDDIDWMHVLVSDDGGQSWDIVGGSHATRYGRHAPGPFYSGRSTEWVDERIDLSQYVGQTVLIRFEYLTDGSVSLPGVVLDDIGIAELNYLDTVEEPLSVWYPEGFLRVPQAVDQNWAVAVLLQDAAQNTSVYPLPLDNNHTGGLTITVPEHGTATVVIGAMAPFSSECARYKIAIQPRPCP